MPRYKVIWDNGHSSGALPGTYSDEEEAEGAGEEWKREMVAVDPDPAEAEEVYSYEVIAEDEEPDCADCGEPMYSPPHFNPEKPPRRRIPLTEKPKCRRCGAESEGGAYCPEGCGPINGGVAPCRRRRRRSRIV